MKKNILLAITIALSFSLAICKQSNASENTSLKDISLSTIVAANTSAESVNDIKGGYGTIINVTESNFDVVISKGLVWTMQKAKTCSRRNSKRKSRENSHRCTRHRQKS